MPSSSSERTAALAIFAAAMIVMGTVHSSNTSWNVNSRMALVLAVVERGTFAMTEGRPTTAMASYCV